MRKIHYTLYREESDYVAQCLDFDVSSFGATRQEALLNLTEAVEIFLEDCPETGPMPEPAFIARGQAAAKAMAKEPRAEHKRWNLPLLSWKNGKAIATKP